MKQVVMSQSNLNVKSFDSIKSALHQPNTSRKQLLNKLKIQFSPNNTMQEMSSAEDGGQKMRLMGGTSRRMPMFADRPNRKSNLKIYQSNDRTLNHTSDIIQYEENSPRSKRLDSQPLRRRFEVRKLLKFRNGVFVPRTEQEMEAVKYGEREVVKEPTVVLGNNISQKKLLSQSSQLLSGVGPKNIAPIQTTGFQIQNKLATRKRGSSQQTYQALLYKLSQADNMTTKAEGFFKEDLFCTPKYREDKLERETMKIRYDRSKVVARSICGTRREFTDFIQQKAMEMAKDKRRRHLMKQAERRKQTESQVRFTQSKMDVNSGGKKGSHVSVTTTKMTQEDLEMQMVMLEEDSAVNKNKIKEHDSEGSSLVDVSLMGDNKDDGGITIKQLKAQEKLSCYQKGWQKMNSILNRPVGKGPMNCSLIDKQSRYVSPRDDILSSFYESSQQTVSNCANERKRSYLLDQAVQEETIKFDNQKCRQSFIGGLRNESFMYVPTTRNTRNSLHARMIVSSMKDPAYDTRASLISCKSPLASCSMMDSMDNRIGRNMPNKLAQTQTVLEQPRVGSQQRMPEGSSRRKLSKKPTQIFDGTVIEQKRPASNLKFRSKRGQTHQGTRTRGIYLPKVAVALKLHEKAQALMAKRLADAEKGQQFND